MIVKHRNLCWKEALTLCFFTFLLLGFEAISTEICEADSKLDIKNRDGVLPSFPLQDDPRLKTSNILKAHEILRNGLQQFLEFREEDLGFYLNYIIIKQRPNFKDEYGQVIRFYNKVFRFVWMQYNETLCNNYAIKEFENDKLDMCSVARFLSHQPSVNDHETIMKRMGDALGYRCHPCTPYKRKEHGENVAPNTDDISPEGVSPKESLQLCKEYDHRGQQVMPSSTAPSTTTSMATTRLTTPAITTTKPESTTRLTTITTTPTTTTTSPASTTTTITTRRTTTATSLSTTKSTAITTTPGSVSTAVLVGKCKIGTLLDSENRDGLKPKFPLREDLRLKSLNILSAHEFLRKGLEQFLQFIKEDFGFYLSNIVHNDTLTFKDEYGQEISSYYKVFQSIWVEYNETLCQNYATNQYDMDNLDLCSVARFLSHQLEVKDRRTLMKRMGDALGYRCHPCTSYKRKEYGGTVVPNTDDLGPIEGLSLEQIHVLCKDYDHHGQKVMVSSTEPPPTTSTFTTTPTTLSPIPTTSNTFTTVPEITVTVGPTGSQYDYRPCSFAIEDVVCDKVPLKEVQKVFKRTSFPRLASVKLTLQPYIFSEIIIPEDIFGTKQILDIGIEYPSDACCGNKLQVDADAFRSTKSYTNKFTINMIDCTHFDLDFLSGFDQLTELHLANIYNIQHCLLSLPPLPKLTSLAFSYCTGMDYLNVFPTLTNGLKYFHFLGNELDIHTIINDETLDRIMDWLLLSSTNTLEEMTITYMSQVTRVPHKIASFKALRILGLSDNAISTIKSGAFSFSVPVSILRISGNGIKEIEPGAFQGDFKDAKINVYNNNLTRFDESVFGPILQQMASGNGFIDVAFDAPGNPIDCSGGSICHLAWLRRYKADFHFWLKCSNGTSFKDLQPAGFNHCP